MFTTKQKIRIAKILSAGVIGMRRFAGLTPFAVCRRRGVIFSLDLTQGIDLAIYLGVYERSTYAAWRRLVVPGMRILDIGANMGAHALVLALAAGAKGRIAAIEPTLFGQRRLAENISLNPELAERIIPIHTFLADMEATATPKAIYASWPLRGGSVGHPLLGGQKESVGSASSSTLDCLMHELRWDRLDLIKIDVDGAEIAILRGSTETLSRFTPAIVIEIAPHLLEEQGASTKELIDVLLRRGYSIHCLESGERLPTEPTQLEARIPRGASINALCRIET